VTVEQVVLRGGTVPVADQTRIGLWVVDASNGQARFVASGVSGPVPWDPLGRMIAYDDRAGPEVLYELDTQTGARTPIVALPTSLGETGASLSWSPNEQTILFTYTGASSTGSTSQVLGINVDSKQSRVLLNSSARLGYLSAQWSPDASRFVVAVTCSVPTFNNYAQLDIANADGTGLVPLTIPARADPCSPTTPPAVAKAAAQQLTQELEPQYITGWTNQIRP
jgi:dipeptidyl aminopeptidase/acylaminoacyl peptidase